MENSHNRIKIKETIVVEGKYDKIRLSPLFDANIIELGGFRIYNNKDRLSLIRRIAEKNGKRTSKTFLFRIFSEKKSARQNPERKILSE